MELIANLVTILLEAILGNHFSNSCTKVPAYFHNERIYLEVKAPGKKLFFYTDSGGGIYPFVYEETATALKMKITRTIQDQGLSIGFSSLPSELKSQNIPLNPSWENQVKVFAPRKGGTDERSQIKFFVKDGFFGATFFAPHIWIFDYPGKKVSYCTELPATEEFTSVPAYFKKTFEAKDTAQARLVVEIDGTHHSMLFDTGATSFYTLKAQKEMGMQERINPSSFVRESVADQWSRMNPGWKKIYHGDVFGGEGYLIEVPSVKIAGLSAGPVWFATRKDSIYERYSRDIMDAPIDGAIGGNFLKHFIILADYPNEKFYFRRP